MNADKTVRRVGIALWWLAAGGLPAASAAGASAPARRVTFIATSDCHYDAFENEDRNQRNRETVRHMNEIGSVRWPDELGGGTIDTPRGVVVLGDMIDDGDRMMQGKNQGAQQYAHYLADFGLDGTDGLLRYRTFELWGNHDGPPPGGEKAGFSLQARLRERNLLRKDKGWLSGLSTNGMHCSWDWDDVHFVQLGLYPADRQHPQVRYNPLWHDPQGALSFLKEDLARRVGGSGRPVVLMAHCGFDTDWWHPDDWKAAYEAARAYNVVLYLYGHTGTGLRRWAPPGENRKWNCVNTGQTENGFFVVELAAERIRLGYRCKRWTEQKPPETGPSRGRPKRTWDGTWMWRFTQATSLPKVTGSAAAAGSRPAAGTSRPGR